MRGTPLLLITVALLLSPSAVAASATGPGQADPAAAPELPRVVITHDTPDDGTTYVGNINDFGFVIQTEEGQPAFHNDAVLEVRLENETLYKTEPSSGHDYDGVDLVQVSFPHPGTYTVHATVPTEDGELTDTFTGTVHPAPDLPAALSVQAPATATAGTPVTFTYELQDEGGERIAHSDVRVRILEADAHRHIFETHTHTHEEAQAFTYTFTEPGTYQVVLTGYQAFPSTDEVWFGPVTETVEVVVEAPAPSVGTSQVPGPPTATPRENRADPGESQGPYTLWGAYDPFTSIGPDGRIVLSTVVLDESTLDPVPHVDFTARLTGPSGDLLFESDTLHEYDGVFELTASPGTYGDHTLEVTATKGPWEGQLTQRFSVLPPVVPVAVGPQFATVSGGEDLVAGEPTALTLHLRNAAGLPFMHSEMQLTVRDVTTGLPVLSDKVHTHNSGDFPVTVTFPEPGTYQLELDPTPLEPAPTAGFHGQELGSPPVYTVEVAPADGGPSTDQVLEPTAGVDEGTEAIPAPGVAVLVVLVSGVAVALGRRRS